MIKLSDSIYISARAVKAIRKSEYHEYIIVETFDGENHSVLADYGQSIYRKLDELVEAVRKDSLPPTAAIGESDNVR